MLNTNLQSRSLDRRDRAHGLSLVELMIGLAVGLILVAGALTLFASNVVGTRNLVRETRVNQDLRAAADLINRDLRRAGYWANAVNGTILPLGGASAPANPYTGISGTFGATSSQVNYNFTRDTNDTLNANEQFGFRLSGGAIQMKTDSTTWQSVTDPDIVTVTKFQVTDTQTNVAVGDMCTIGCNTTPPTPASAPTSACPNPPTVIMHRFDVLIEGNAATDSRIKRTLRESVRVRNNQFSGSCP